MNRAMLESLARSWRRHRALRHGGFSLAAAGIAAAIALRLSPLASLIVGLVALATTALVLRRSTPLITAATCAEHLNRLDPRLEESVSLWLRDPESLSLVERLQLRRLTDVVSNRNLPEGALPSPRSLLPALGSVVGSAFILAFALVTLRSPQPSAPRSGEPVPGTAATRTPSWSATLNILPPAYLGRPPRQVSGLSADVEEGSQILGTLVTDAPIAALEMIGAEGRPAFPVRAAGNGRFQFGRPLLETTVFQIAFLQNDGTRTLLPELHVLRVTRDQPPTVRWISPALPRTTLSSSNHPPSLPIQVLATDDHDLGEVRLVWTLAQGSGEGVTFREQTAVLTPLEEQGDAGTVYGMPFHLADVGLKPGDELYLHVVARDRKTPKPNESRSDTRLVTVLSAPAEPTADAVVLPGFRRLPQYFRSQRQLILDTEQLLAEQASLSEAQFRARSESIGVDQKLLRLRYGHFLGEEFEPASSGAPREALAMEWAGALRQPPGEDLQRAAAIGRAIEATHQHDPPPSHSTPPTTRQPIIAPLTHQHDSPEAATLFNDQVKQSLRAVLSAMWEAEGLLRTAQPAAALPAEQRALETLKALQQADRLSVRQIGSEPPPVLVEERRLRGDLDAIPLSAAGTPPGSGPERDPKDLADAIASLAGDLPFNPPEAIAEQIDARLVRAAQSDPSRYLPALELWRARDRSESSSLPMSPPSPPAPLPQGGRGWRSVATPGEGPTPDGSWAVSFSGRNWGLPTTLRQVLASLLTPPEPSPARRRELAPELARRYAEALGVSGNPEP